jgi:hypothetical protein
VVGQWWWLQRGGGGSHGILRLLILERKNRGRRIARWGIMETR